MREGQRRDRGLIYNEQHEDHDGGPGEGRLGTCIVGAVCSDAQRLGAAQGDAREYGEDECGGGGDGGDGQGEGSDPV